MRYSLFPFSHGNVYLFSLCVATQSKIKTTPNRIHVSIFLWREPGSAVMHWWGGTADRHTCCPSAKPADSVPWRRIEQWE